MLRIAIIPACKERSDKKCKATEFYQSNMFRLAKQYAERHCDGIAILSCKWGVLSPLSIVEPYTETIGDMTQEGYAMWAMQVCRQIMVAYPPKTHKFILLGAPQWCAPFAKFPHTVNIYRGLKQGHREKTLKWLIGDPKGSSKK